MTVDPASLQNLLLMAAIQFVAGCLGLVSRRGLFPMLLSGLIMLQGLSVAIAAVSAAQGHVGGTSWLFVVWGTAAAQLAFAVTLMTVVARRRNSTDVARWRSLRESEHDPLSDGPSDQ